MLLFLANLKHYPGDCMATKEMTFIVLIEGTHKENRLVKIDKNGDFDEDDADRVEGVLVNELSKKFPGLNIEVVDSYAKED